jgi:hypothetical protein
VVGLARNIDVVDCIVDGFGDRDYTEKHQKHCAVNMQCEKVTLERMFHERSSKGCKSTAENERLLVAAVTDAAGR